MVESQPLELLTPEYLRDPHPLLARLRAEASLVRVHSPETQGAAWLVTHYADCLALLRDVRFTKSLARMAELRGDGGQDFAQEAARAINHHMLMADPPDHTRLRGLVHKAFTPRIIAGLAPRIQAIADELLDAVQAQGRMELVRDFARPLPVTVIAELLGVPLADRERFRRWTDTIAFQAGSSERREELGVAALEFVMYFHELFARRRAEPQDDLISGLVQAEEDGQRLDAQELVSMVFLLLIAGYETTLSLIANGILTLLRHPAATGQLRADMALLPTAIEEILRYEGPVATSTMRWALEDLEFCGQPIRRGELLLASLLAANRDPAVFHDAGRFAIMRAPNRHIAFGYGIHFCLGAPLARLEGRIALATLLRRLPRLRLDLAEEDIRWRPSVLLHTLEALPLAF